MDLEGRYQEHPVFDPPEDRDASIWRYVDFTKLVSLLDRRRLFFARTDTFSDEFEGSTSRFNIEARPRLYAEIPPEQLASIAQTTADFRRWTFINCWNLSEHESAAFWGLYVPPTGGVAIRSTFRRLTEAFGPTDPLPDGDPMTRIYVGKVRYANYERDWIPEGNTMWTFMHKRHSFEFEHELRALIQKFPHEDGIEGEGRIDFNQPVLPGLGVHVDLERLIEQIHVSPTAPDWFAELVSSTVTKYRCSAQVVQSSLAGTPVY